MPPPQTGGALHDPLDRYVVMTPIEDKRSLRMRAATRTFRIHFAHADEVDDWHAVLHHTIERALATLEAPRPMDSVSAALGLPMTTLVFRSASTSVTPASNLAGAGTCASHAMKTSPSTS